MPENVIDFDYVPPFIHSPLLPGTEEFLKEQSALYDGAEFGPTYYFVRKVDIFGSDGKPKETMPTEVFRFVSFNLQTQKSAAVAETSEGLIKLVVDAIKQQNPNR